MHVYSHKSPTVITAPNAVTTSHSTNPHQDGFRAISVREVGLQAIYPG